MKIKVVENPPVDPREFDLPEGFSEENIEDVVEIFNTPLIGHYNWDYTAVSYTHLTLPTNREV